MPHIDNEVKLDFKDVLIRPKRSYLSSRSQVSLNRTLKFKHSPIVWTGIPLIAANMDTVGTFEMAEVLCAQDCLVAIHKHYSIEAWKDWASSRGASLMKNVFVSTGISEADLVKLDAIISSTGAQMICVDVANGYSEAFVSAIKRIRAKYPNHLIAAGNVVTSDMTEELVLAGADIVKVGIGPGSVCTTRRITGVGFPQLSAVLSCADAAHGLGGRIISDGGCTCPGDVCKAFGAGSDFVMLGGMLAGHDESAGELEKLDCMQCGNCAQQCSTARQCSTCTAELNAPVSAPIPLSFPITAASACSNPRWVKRFYGMSSSEAMHKYSGGVANYRASEGKCVRVPYRGPVAETISDILGGLRSCCTYVGATELRELAKRTTFIRVSEQLNNVFTDSTKANPEPTLRAPQGG